jgi:hypothetical protein
LISKKEKEIVFKFNFLIFLLYSIDLRYGSKPEKEPHHGNQGCGSGSGLIKNAGSGSGSVKNQSGSTTLFVASAAHQI